MKRLIVSVLLLLGATLIFSQGNEKSENTNAQNEQIIKESTDTKLS